MIYYVGIFVAHHQIYYGVDNGNGEYTIMTEEKIKDYLNDKTFFGYPYKTSIHDDLFIILEQHTEPCFRIPHWEDLKKLLCILSEHGIQIIDRMHVMSSDYFKPFIAYKLESQP